MSDDGQSNGPLSEEDLEDLFENAPCGYVSTHPDGRITKVNRTFLSWTGFSADQLRGRKLQDLLTIAGKIYYETHFAPLLRMQGVFNEVALDLVTASGGRLPVLVNAVERRDAAGGLQFIRLTVFNATDRRRYEQELLAARRAAEQASAELRELNATLEARVAAEVTERLRSEEALRQLQKMEAVGQLTGGVAHDFNNLLQIIIGSLDILQRHLPEDARRLQRSAANAMTGARRAAELTQRLLAFSRRQPLAPKPLEVNRLVRDMSELLHRTLGERVELETVFSARLWVAEADQNQLENALINLAVNARDAMPNGGKLTIETSNSYLDEAYATVNAEVRPGQYVAIAVSDTGTGMDAEIKARVFEPFFTTKEPGKGTGMGLSQVYGFVKQSGGHVAIYSELGHGTTIKLYLPRSEAKLAAEQRQTEHPVPEGAAGETVLVLEDDEGVRAFSTEVLRELGYRVLEAATPEAALDILRKDEPHVQLLFSDVVLPGQLTGADVAMQARALRPDLKVLFTTGYARNAVVHQGRLKTGVQLITKPFTVSALAAKVREVLDGA